MAESPPEGAALRAWRTHEALLRDRLATERGRPARRALWRALAEARRILELIDPARGAAAAAAVDVALPASLDQLLAARWDEWDDVLERLGDAPASWTGDGADPAP